MNKSKVMKLLFVFAMFTSVFLAGCGSSASAGSAPVPEGDEAKSQSKAFDHDSHTQTAVGTHTVEIPSSWPANPPYYYPENGYVYEDQGFAMLYVFSTAMDIDAKSFLSEPVRKGFFEDLTEDSASPVLKISETRTVNGKKMNYISYTDTIEDIPGLVRSYWYLQEGGTEVITLLFFQGDNVNYSYKDDLDKIAASLQ